MRKHIHISQLSSPCITRWRGQEAGEKLQGYLEDEPIEIDLNEVEMVSLSFLDGLVSYLLTLGSMDKVIFRASDPMVEDKLARVAGIRLAPLFYRVGDGDIRQLVPKHTISKKPTFVPSKPVLR